MLKELLDVLVRGLRAAGACIFTGNQQQEKESTEIRQVAKPVIAAFVGKPIPDALWDRS